MRMLPLVLGFEGSKFRLQGLKPVEIQSLGCGLGQSVQRLERAQGSRQSGNESQNVPVQASHPGAGSQTQEDARNTGQHSRGSESPVDHRGAAIVERPTVGSGTVQIGAGYQGQNGHTGGPDEHAHPDGPGTQGGSHDPVSTQRLQAVDGGHERRIRGVQDIHSPARTAGPSAPSGVPATGRVCSTPAHRSKPTQGAPSPVQGGRQGQRGNVRSPYTRTKLQNPPGSNACYINTTVLALLHACQRLQDTDELLGRMTPIKQAVNNSRRPIVLRDMLTFQVLMRGWREPTRQHDIAEFFHHIT